jgi:hypothetical protein
MCVPEATQHYREAGSDDDSTNSRLPLRRFLRWAHVCTVGLL